MKERQPIKRIRPIWRVKNIPPLGERMKLRARSSGHCASEAFCLLAPSLSSVSKMPPYSRSVRTGSVTLDRSWSKSTALWPPLGVERWLRPSPLALEMLVKHCWQHVHPVPLSHKSSAAPFCPHLNLPCWRYTSPIPSVLVSCLATAWWLKAKQMCPLLVLETRSLKSSLQVTVSCWTLSFQRLWEAVL